LGILNNRTEDYVPPVYYTEALYMARRSKAQKRAAIAKTSGASPNNKRKKSKTRDSEKSGRGEKRIDKLWDEMCITIALSIILD